jgi:hypothetical protein
MGTPVGMGTEICDIMARMAAIIPANAKSLVEMRLDGTAVRVVCDEFIIETPFCYFVSD